MHPLFLARGRAYLLDCLAHLAVPAALVPVGLVVRHRAGGPDRRLVLALSAIPPAVSTLLAAAAESRTGTWGHRAEGLTVLTSDGRVPSSRRALLRNAVEVGAPWQLGHVVALGAAEGGFERRDPWTITAAAVLHPWLAAAVVAVAVGPGQGLHDRVAATHVVSEASPPDAARLGRGVPGSGPGPDGRAASCWRPRRGVSRRRGGRRPRASGRARCAGRTRSCPAAGTPRARC